MKRAAKLLLADKDGRYLLLYRGNHPSFPFDPDIPGGAVNENEEPISAAVRELLEETGIVINVNALEKVYESNEYDPEYTYYLYKASYEGEPTVNISWEHSRFEWLKIGDFTNETHKAVDEYMHMVYDYLTKTA